MKPTILPAANRDVLPWKNGGGFAAEVVWSGTGERAVPFDWRITIATIERDGAFSDFSGVDRLLMCAGPDGLTLVVDGLPWPLDREDVLVFAGESAVTSTGVAQPTLALNLMLRRGAASGTLDAVPLGEDVVIDADGAEVVAVVVAGSVTALGRALEMHDAVRWSSGSVAFAGSGTLAFARIIAS